MSERKIKGVLNSRETDGSTEYKVRFQGCDRSEDDWVPAAAVGQKQIANFLERKAKQSSAAAEGRLKPNKTIEKKQRPAEKKVERVSEGGSDSSEEDAEAAASEAKRLEREDDGIPISADEVNPADIIQGPRRRRAAAEAAERSSEWGRLNSDISALGDDSDSD